MVEFGVEAALAVGGEFGNEQGETLGFEPHFFFADGLVEPGIRTARKGAVAEVAEVGVAELGAVFAERGDELGGIGETGFVEN